MSDTAYAIDAAPLEAAAAALPERADVVVVGAGFTGLSAALHLAEAGRSVTVVEKGEIAGGASGRNGGQLHPDQRPDQAFLLKTLGEAAADRLFALGGEAVDLVHSLRARLGAPCDFTPGVIHAAHSERAMRELADYADFMERRYGVEGRLLGRDALAAAIGSSHYVGGVKDARGGHLNPLAFARALAAGAAAAGARLVPATRVVSVGEAGAGGGGGGGAPRDAAGPRRVATTAGTVSADTVILAGNGMMAGLDRRLDARILPLVNYIAATRPLAPLIPGGEAVADTRRVIRYFRQDAAGRLIFGGGETFMRRPRDIAAFVRPYLAEVYPDLAHAPIAAAWSGMLGITATRCPLLRRLDPGLYAAAGFSGQGVGIGTLAGKVIAEAVAGDTDKLDVFSKMPVPVLPGGRHAKLPLAMLAMAWFSLRDRLG